MGGAEFRAGQSRPFGQVNLSPDFRAGGGSGGARGGEPTEHVTGIHPETVSLGQKFQLFNPLNTPSFTVKESSIPNITFYSFKVLQTNFSPPIPFIIEASNQTCGSLSKVVFTPLNPDLGYKVNEKDFTVSTRIDRYLQEPDFRKSERNELVPLWLEVQSVSELYEVYPSNYTNLPSYDYFSGRTIAKDHSFARKQNEYLMMLSGELDAWFRNTPESKELMENLYFKLRSPDMDLASHPIKDMLEYRLHDSGLIGVQLWFETFFPTDTGKLPFDYAEWERRGLFHKVGGSFTEGYPVQVPDNLDALSLLTGSFNQLPS